MNRSDNSYDGIYAPVVVPATLGSEAPAETIDCQFRTDATVDRDIAITDTEKRIHDFIDWYTELPESELAGMDVEQRLRLGRFFGAQFARTRVVVDELKTTPRTEEIARGPGIRRQISVMSSYMRRYLKREFYHLQAGYRIREGRGDFELAEAWVDEFLARSHWFLKDYSVQEDRLDTQVCCLIDVNVLTPRLEEVLDGLLRADRIMASCRLDPDWQRVKLWLGSLLIEPLGWIKDVRLHEVPVSRFPVLTKTIHIQRHRSATLTSTNRCEATPADDSLEEGRDTQAAETASQSQASEPRISVRRKRSLEINPTTPS